jgi:hypothetical protein
VLENLRDRGDSTVEEIAKDLHARNAEVRAACVALYMADRITRSERPREDGKPGPAATIYGPKAPANGYGTEIPEQGGKHNNGTKIPQGKETKIHNVDGATHDLRPIKPPSRAREDLRPTIPVDGAKPLFVPESLAAPPRDCSSPWPDEIDGLGRRHIEALTVCSNCDVGTVAFYGPWPLCLRCANLRRGEGPGA